MARGLPVVTPAPSKTDKVNGVRLPMGKARRRTTLPLLGVGVLCVLLSVAVYGVITSRLDHRSPVLVLTQRVEAGQVIAATDLQALPMSGADGLGVFSGGDGARVVGQTAVGPLPAGTVLTRSMVGELASFPPPGQRLVSLSLKAGQYPQRLAAGARVEAYLGVAAAGQPTAARGQAGGDTAPQKVTATVYEVDSAAAAADGQSGAVVSLLLDAGDATRVASAAGAVLLMQMPAGER